MRQTAGVVGAVLVLCGYALLSQGLAPALAQVLSILGSITLFILAFQQRIVGYVLLNAVWIVLSVVALDRLLFW